MFLDFFSVATMSSLWNYIKRKWLHFVQHASFISQEMIVEYSRNTVIQRNSEWDCSIYDAGNPKFSGPFMQQWVDKLAGRMQVLVAVTSGYQRHWKLRRRACLGWLHACFSLKLNYCETFHSVDRMTYFKECTSRKVLDSLYYSHRIIQFTLL